MVQSAKALAMNMNDGALINEWRANNRKVRRCSFFPASQSTCEKKCLWIRVNETSWVRRRS